MNAASAATPGTPGNTGKHPALTPSGRHEVLDREFAREGEHGSSRSGSRSARSGSTWDMVTNSRWVIALIAVTVLRGIAIAFLPVLLLEAPVALLAFSPAAGDLVLVAPLINVWLFVGVSMTAALLQCAIFYEFGRALGEKALGWLNSRGIVSPKQTQRIQGWLARASGLVLLAAPGLTVSALAGASGVRARLFYPAMVVGNLAWTVACFIFGSALTTQLELLYGFIGDNVLPLTIVAAALFAAHALWSRLRNGNDGADLEEGPPLDESPEP